MPLSAMRDFDVLIISGPTASGKSGLALQIAEANNGVVINADALQVYAELRVLTARPDKADEARVPHFLYGHRAIMTPYAVTDWLREITPVIETAWRDGRLPIIVGGTGFYLQTLLHGMSPVPDVPDEMRQETARLYDILGHDSFRRQLHAVDPAAATRIKPNDRQRLSRAHEVWLATGQSLSHWQDQPRIAPLPHMRSHSILLQPPRDTLYAAIDARFLRMLAQGALDEAQAVEDLHPDPTLPGLKALGLSPLRAHLRGEMSLSDAVQAGQIASRQYAKRQTTWLRTQWPETDRHGIARFENPAAMLQTLRR